LRLTASPHLLIRAALPEEAESLSALARESKAHWGYGADLLTQWHNELSVDPNDIRRHPIYVAEVDSRISGFYMLKKGTTFWTLEHLWVHPTVLRRGIGSRLLRHALSVARSSNLGRIVVTAEPNATGFYEREGGVKAGVELAPIPTAPDRVLPVYEFGL
jgi:ribosomal protein S18 acetylase RimI-like enzyme